MITLWFFIWVFLWVMFFITDGYDLGLGALLPAVAKNDKERGLVHASIGPYWDGNEVWLIGAGGMTFAAFPGAYATLFSAMYTALMLVLVGLVVRGAAIGLRESSRSESERRVIDYAFSAASLALCILFGTAFANIFRGVPIDAAGIFQGGFFTLLNWYGLLGGLFFTATLLHHGALWFMVKADGPAAERAGRLIRWLFVGTAGLGAVFVFATGVVTGIARAVPDRPLMVIPLLAAIGGLLASAHFAGKTEWKKAFTGSAAFIAGLIFFCMAGIYPALLPSSLDPAFSVTATGAASSPLTLKIMLGVVAVFLPIIFGYQWWAARIFKGKAQPEDHY